MGLILILGNLRNYYEIGSKSKKCSSKLGESA